MNFTIFYKEKYSNINELGTLNYDIFISGFDNCSRTTEVFDKVNAAKKIWLIFPQYEIPYEEFPKAEYYQSTEWKEDEYFRVFFDTLNSLTYTERFCIDMTGFIKPHFIYLLKYLSIKGIKKIDLLYTEPKKYVKADETEFSGHIDKVRPIEGCGAVKINPNLENDLLIIAAGYDNKLISKVAQEKDHSKNKYFIIGFPSHQPDMYQENLLKIENSKESVGENVKNINTPAFDPFITAQTLSDIVHENSDATNIYLCPIASKPQTAGFALFYLWNYEKLPISIIFPFSNTYSTKNAIGIKRTWKYTFELP